METNQTIRMEAIMIAARIDYPTRHILDLLDNAQTIVEYIMSGKQPEPDIQDS